MQQSGEKQISLTDPESRAMYLGQSIQISYNVQTAVEGKNKFIVEHEVTNSVTDLGQLLPLAMKAKEILQAEKLELLADMGYYYGDQIKSCQEAGITSYIPKPNSSANLKRKMFTKENFIYEAEKDRYRCPAEKYLTYRFDTVERKRHIRYYVASGCNRCHLKSKCTRNDVRRITRWVGEDILDEMARRIRSHREKVHLRKTLSEHPFGTMKRAMDQGYFLMRGLQKVSAEVSLSVLAYNMKRAFTILGVTTLIQALK
ncbi:transposase [bacterium]|nr:transposase [bacterium]